MSVTLITGGAGYIGGHVSWACADAVRRFVVIDNLSTGSRKSLPPGTVFVEADISDDAALVSAIRDNGVTSIMHFAGSTVVPDSVADPASYYTNNTVNSLKLLRVALACGVNHMIFSSTAAVYAPAMEGLVTEDSPLRPENPYGRSKLMFEQMLADAAAAYDFRYIALRYFNVAGADPAGRVGQSTPNATHLIKVAAQAALGVRPEMFIFGDDYATPDGTCIRDFIHVSDLADAHMLALGYLENGGRSQTLNCGYGVGISVREAIAGMERASGARIPIRLAPRRPGDAPRIVADSTRLKKTLAWRPQHADLDEIVKSALEWERSLSAPTGESAR